MAEKPETRIAKKIIAAIRQLPDAHARKVFGGPMSGTTGEPDVDACIAGRAVKLEVKTPTNRRGVTPLQRQALLRWEAAGAVVAVVTSVDDASAVLRYCGVLTPHDYGSEQTDLDRETWRRCVQSWRT